MRSKVRLGLVLSILHHVSRQNEVFELGGIEALFRKSPFGTIFNCTLDLRPQPVWSIPGWDSKQNIHR